MEKKVFLFLYEHLKLGGIEKNLIEQIITYSKMGIRIIWLRYGNIEDIYTPWKEVLNKYKVEIIDVNINTNKLIVIPNLQFEENEVVYATCYEPIDFARLEIIANHYRQKFNLYYIVPHFTGITNYLEDRFSLKILRYKVKNELSRVYDRWYKNGNLLFFNLKHEMEMQKRYSVECINKEKINKSVLELKEFDSELAKKRSKRNEFRIITCGRFEFPHKGYIFGLVDSFCKLKIKYPQLKLDIIGYGIHESKIRDYIEKVSPNIKKDINIIGSVSPDKLSNYFDRCHLNVSVAGALTEGAYSGLISLAARHYCYTCEVYDWLNRNSGNTLDDKPGNPVENYIEELINMSDENYIKLCHQSYEYAITKKESDPNWLFNQKNISLNYYSINEVHLFKKINTYWKIKFGLKCCIYRPMNKLGLIEFIHKMKEIMNK
ncbi:MAG: hypothetical protein KHZ15_09245 [Coprobacillus cateniformis]|uniref:glycosyltransferase n=1 Tax=Longibaculum muris TaxID=1796628 RepID=UPI003AB5951F|nr:hypothetical protein [Coprobacillus cateniformis]